MPGSRYGTTILPLGSHLPLKAVYLFELLLAYTPFIRIIFPPP